MTDPASRTTYTPLDTLKPVAENIWIVDSGPISPGGVHLPVRMTVIRLPSGAMWLHSPTRFAPQLLSEIEAIGPVRHIVAPNIAHWMFVQQWQRRCPNAVAWAAPNLRRRRQVRKKGIRFDRELREGPPPEWEGAIGQELVPGGFGFAEIVFLHKPSQTAILTDLVQNLEADKLSFGARLFARLAGTLAPDGKPPIYLRLVVSLRQSAAREAARRILAFAPERVVFAHGRWFERDGTAELRRALRWLTR